MDLDPVVVLSQNAAQARARAVTLTERAEAIEEDPEMTFATGLLRRGAEAQRVRAEWLLAEAARLAQEGVL